MPRYLKIPARAGRKARTATLELRCAPIRPHPPNRLEGAPILALWAVHAVEPAPAADSEAVEWPAAERGGDDAPGGRPAAPALVCRALERRGVSSHPQERDRRLGDAESLPACLALDLAVAWRAMDLAKRGRETPPIPCTAFFAKAQRKALACHRRHSPHPPETPPALGEAMGMVAKLGGSLGRKSHRHPGATVIRRGLSRLSDSTETFLIFYPSLPAGP